MILSTRDGCTKICTEKAQMTRQIWQNIKNEPVDFDLFFPFSTCFDEVITPFWSNYDAKETRVAKITDIALKTK